MANGVNLNVPLNWTTATPAERELLQNLQGNILKGHGRNHTANVFLAFDGSNKTEVKEFLAGLAKDKVTSAFKQLKEAAEFKKSRKKGTVFVSVFLSAAGYDALGVEPEKTPGTPGDAFRSGMKARGADLNDPPSDTWDELFRQNDIHAMILVGDDNQSIVDREVAAILKTLPPSVRVLGVERGKAMRNANNDGIEHFGYVDGRSQPLLLAEDIENEKAKTDGISVWDPSAPLKLALIPDPGVGDGAENCFGSFFVFRKLEQNVKGFKEREEELADILKLKCDDRERAGALVVGRFEDGTPVTHQYAEGSHHPVPNNFDYKDDQEGNKCPFHAHIRKTNPRGESVGKFAATLEEEREHLLVRRGITYGEREIDPETKELTDRPEGGVGLLFMDYQSSIENQFEFVQSLWANNPDFVNRGIDNQPNTGIDPVIGQGGGGAPQQWPAEWGELCNRNDFSFEGFVTLKGGEYFFAPSICFLKEVDSGVGNSSGATGPSTTGNNPPQAG